MTHLGGEFQFINNKVFKWAIFVRCKQNFTEKTVTVGFSRIRTHIVILEGKQADHQTTATGYLLQWRDSNRRPSNYLFYVQNFLPRSLILRNEMQIFKRRTQKLFDICDIFFFLLSRLGHLEYELAIRQEGANAQRESYAMHFGRKWLRDHFAESKIEFKLN